MKAMKKALVNTCCILGILSFGLLAGCADIINNPSSVSPDVSAGMGRAVVSIGPRLNGARTFMPTTGIGYYEGLSYAFEFTAVGKNPVSGSITDGTGSVELEEGTWDLTVTGKDGNTGILEGKVMGVVITAGVPKAVHVALAAFTEIGAVSGTLTYSVIIPDDVIKGTLTVYGWDDETVLAKAVDLQLTGTANSDNTISAAGNFPLTAGYYRIALDLYKANGVFHQSDIAHIYPGLTTAATYNDVGAGDFIAATVNNGAGLATVLGGIGGLLSDRVYLLPAGGESMSAAAAVSNTNPVTVTIDGGGRTVTLNSAGSLITVGDKVTLVLTNITLQGQGLSVDNNAALVAVQNGGKLELGPGAKITGNRNYSSLASYDACGGGVYVGFGGAFTMNGGEISGNEVSSSADSPDSPANPPLSYGGGVYVSDSDDYFSTARTFFTMNGGKISGNAATFAGGGVALYYSVTFTMNGGEISGNRVSSSSLYNTLGGGVYLAYSTTFFTMNGGKISGNLASSSSSDVAGNAAGGGVYNGASSTFTMNGGEISGNAVFSSADSNSVSSGGGVSVGAGAAFTLNGGEISNNSASASNNSSTYGGGVSAGAFTMNGGKISNNSVSSTSSTSYVSSYSHGGGVFASGNFAMSGGEISGNTASHDGGGDNSGGGVYTDANGNFAMSGGEISGNSASGGGGGVYLHYVGTFTMSGGARVDVNNPVCLDDDDYLYYIAVVTIGGDFTGPPGPVAKIDLNGGASNWLGKAVLKLASGYSSGDLSALKNRFTLGSFGDTTPITGYVIDDNGTLQTPSIGIANVSYDDVSGSNTWMPLSDGRRQSPSIGYSSVTKSRVNFTATQANASIRIKLEVSSESNYDWAFISTLDNASATYENGYYSGSKISGTNSVTVTIPVPTAGNHFVDIGYRKDGSEDDGEDRAWYRVILE